MIPQRPLLKPFTVTLSAPPLGVINQCNIILPNDERQQITSSQKVLIFILKFF